MNYLELAVNLRIECSVAGVGPVSLNDNRAEYQRLIRWIRDANTELQGKYANWRFLWNKDEFETIAGIDYYLVGETIPAHINVYRPESFTINGELLQETDFYDRHLPVDETTKGKPSLVIVQPNNDLRLWPIPNKADTIAYEYYAQPQILKEADDIPLIPEPWHKLIVYRAMMMYGDYENAVEVKQAGMEGLSSIMPQLETNQLPGQRDMGMVNEYDFVVRPE